MKALSLMEAGDVRVVDVPEPAVKDGELLLQVEMVGLCGSDLNSFRGRNPLITYPRVLGHEIAATVLEGNASIPAGTHVAVSPYLGCGVCPACTRGRENTCRHNLTYGVQRDGAFVERLAVAPGKVFPSTLPLRYLCMVEPLTVGFHAAARGRITKEDTVAVFGCGGVGLGAIAGAAFNGARVIAIDLDDTKLATARLAGAAEVIHSGREDTATRLREMTQGEGPDVVIEAIGLPSTFRLAVEVVAFAGRVVYIGYAKEPIAYETRLFVQKELDILGSRNALPQDFRRVVAMLETGRFPVDEAITTIVPLERAPSMLSEWAANPAGFTKIMVEVAQ
ncbi:zinc-binding alcohol dehydrogenase family protein [Paracidobacterium acidisoli]|uniref:Zinc-binding alcohol dehydrogenase family protein n=1 Tax=Paracidobacterium acidisoli TaxID=2303751 RepID=A0A372ITE4_9BACT|nr:zinc-binding alcohol dehydrogenase family protein [Paracidobacterium acidisoli]MBT9329597.1 zinc-binding alcohol dehydrogenase family protein [Paracidobacterium acidisoli]